MWELGVELDEGSRCGTFVIPDEAKEDVLRLDRGTPEGERLAYRQLQGSLASWGERYLEHPLS